MPTPRTLTLTVAAAMCAATLVTQTLASCSFISSSFTCSQYTYKNFASSCTCFSCNGVNGVGSYECASGSGSVLCSGSFYSPSAQYDSPKPPGSTDTYVLVGVYFVGASCILYGLLFGIARCFQKDKANTGGSSCGRWCSIQGICSWVSGWCSIRAVYGWVFGSMYKSDKIQLRSLCECWVTGSELLDCIWCCSRRKGNEEEWRPLPLRVMRLAASLSIGASLGMMFGSLEFDSMTCTEQVNMRYCSTRTQTIDLKGNSSVCESGSSILSSDSLVSTAAIIATLSTQIVKYVGGYAQGVGKPGTKLDIGAHVIWLLAAAAAIPICNTASTSMFTSEDNDIKDTRQRMQLVIGVTLASWIQDQLLDIVKAPVWYLARLPVVKFLPNPNAIDKHPSVQPVRGDPAKAKYAPGAPAVNHGGKVDSIAPPKRAKK